jgi:hypothetical protein
MVTAIWSVPNRTGTSNSNSRRDLDAERGRRAEGDEPGRRVDRPTRELLDAVQVYLHRGCDRLRDGADLDHAAGRLHRPPPPDRTPAHTRSCSPVRSGIALLEWNRTRTYRLAMPSAICAPGMRSLRPVQPAKSGPRIDARLLPARPSAVHQVARPRAEASLHQLWQSARQRLQRLHGAAELSAGRLRAKE